MLPLRLGPSFWLDRHTQAPLFPTLHRDLRVDVAIVGGGLTGAAIAWRFAEAGVRVALVEARRIGRGSTAASTALLMQEPDVDLRELARRYGKARARRMWQLSRTATREFVRTIDQLGIECDLVDRDSVYYALTKEAAERLQIEHRGRRRAGFGGRWLNAAQLDEAAGLKGAGAIRTHGNAQFDPYKACLGFARAAVERGAQVFERTQVAGTRAIGNSRLGAGTQGVVLRTPHGSVTADRVIVATGYATERFKPLAGRFRMLHTYVLGTRRLSRAERRRLGLGVVMLWETGRPYHYARWTADHRLLLGGGDRTRVRGLTRARAFRDGTQRVAEYFVGVYPALAQMTFEYAWEGLFAMTPDGLPYIGPHELYPNHLFALGYGGNGMTFGFLAARLLLEMYQGRESPDHELFAFSRSK
jgi:glycine/D-amino acid oxidase-like deaminating enzyme